MPALRVSVAPSPAQQQPFHGVLPADGPVRLDAVGHRRVAVHNSAGDAHSVILPGNNRRRKKGTHPSNTCSPSNWIPHLEWDGMPHSAAPREPGTWEAQRRHPPAHLCAPMHQVRRRTARFMLYTIARPPPAHLGAARDPVSAHCAADSPSASMRRPQPVLIRGLGPVRCRCGSGGPSPGADVGRVPRRSRALQQHHHVLDGQRRWLRRCTAAQSIAWSLSRPKWEAPAPCQSVP
jgi:hypothetical protein